MNSHRIILKYLFINEYRREFSAVIEVVSDFFNTKINHFYIHLLSLLIKLINPLIVCLLISALGFPNRLSFMLWISIGFCFVAAVVDGNNSAQRVFLPEENNILLHSAVDDNIIHYIIMIKELINYILSSLSLFIIPVYLIFSSSSSFLTALINTFIFFISCLILFIIGIYAKKNEYYKINSGFFEEIFYIIKIALFSFIFYVLIKSAVNFINKGQDYVIQGYSIIDGLKNIIADTLSTSFPFIMQKINCLRLMCKEYIGYTYSNTIILTIMMFIFVIIVGALFAQNTPVKYRFKPPGFKYGIKYKLLKKLIFTIYKLIPKTKKEVYIKKDLKMILRNYRLIFKIPFLQLVLPGSFFIYAGLLLSAYESNNFNAVVIASIYTVMRPILDYGHMLKCNLPFIVLPNAEMRNISLIKISNYGYLKMLAQKVSIITNMSILPAVIVLLLQLYISIIYSQFYIGLYLILIIWTVFILLISGWLQLYGYCYNINYGYQNYSEMTKLSAEINFFDKFYIIPKKILDLIYTVFLVITFYGLLQKILINIFIIINIFYFFIIILLIVKTVKKGKKYFYEKNIIQT